MGMGLAITRSIIEAHGGHIRATNNPEAGLTVEFTLPTELAGVTAASAPRPPRPTSTQVNAAPEENAA
jgi:K+-sensing histidine kinase KdpD